MWFFGGLVVTILTYSFASNGGGGPYVVAWGPVVVGLFLLLKGLIGVLAGDSEVAPVTEEMEATTLAGKCPSCKTRITFELKNCPTCGRHLVA